MTRAAAVATILVLLLAAAGCGGSKKETESTTTAASSASLLTTLTAVASCPQLAELRTTLLQALAGAGGNVKQQVAAIEREAAKTPEAVRDDFETIADALGDAADELKAVDLKNATSATITGLMAKIASPDVNDAAARIGDWAAKNCK